MPSVLQVLSWYAPNHYFNLVDTDGANWRNGAQNYGGWLGVWFLNCMVKGCIFIQNQSSFHTWNDILNCKHAQICIKMLNSEATRCNMWPTSHSRLLLVILIQAKYWGKVSNGELNNRKNDIMWVHSWLSRLDIKHIFLNAKQGVISAFYLLKQNFNLAMMKRTEFDHLDKKPPNTRLWHIRGSQRILC